MLVQLAVLNRASDDNDVARECGWDPDQGKVGDAELLAPALVKRAPLCCWLGDDRFGGLLLEVLSDSRLASP